MITMTILRRDPRDELVPIDVDAALASAHDRLALKRANPDAVKHTLKQCEAVVVRLEAMRARQERGPNERIVRLLETPVVVLSDRVHWPNADDLSEAGVQATAAYGAWLVERARQVGGPWEAAARWSPENGPPGENDRHARALLWLLRHATVSFPVGASCLELADGYPAAAARELMPFDDDAHAAIVLAVPSDDRDVTFFFMARQERYELLFEGEWLPGPDPDGDAEPGLPVWVIDGTDVRTTPPRPRGFRDTRRDARRWWKSMAGLRIEPGHPKGRRDRTSRQMIDALIAYKAQHGPTPPPLKQFLDHALADREESSRRTTWRRLSRDCKLSWQVMRREVYGTARRQRRHIDRG